MKKTKPQEKQKVLIDTEAFLETFKDESDEAVGLFVRSLVILPDNTVVDHLLMNGWLDWYHNGGGDNG